MHPGVNRGMGTLNRTILIFIDGLGWGPPAPLTNPQHAYGGEVFRLPAAASAAEAPVPVFGGGWARPIDAVLGVPGIPQSATGQTTLLSGVNSQAAIGQHLTGFPNEALRNILLEHSVLRTLTRGGVPARFLNAFRPRFWELSREKQLTLSATTVCNLAADLPFFTLARAARDGGGFTLYEYFLSDKAGHTGDAALIAGELVKLDAFVRAVLDELSAELRGGTQVLLTSDHGNLEDATTRRHTTNPVPLMVWGDDARETAASVTRLDQVTPAIVARHSR